MRPPTLCASAALALTAAGWFALPAQAANATQTACSQQYQAAKSAGTLNGQKWSDYYSACAANLKASDAAATPPKVAPAPAAAPAMPSPTLKKSAATTAGPSAATASAAANSGQSTSSICSGQYQAAKSAGTLGGQSWGKFLSACAANIKNYAEPTAQAPSEPPAMAPAQAKTAIAAPTTDANGKALSPGEIAFQQRIHACSQQWQSQKAAGTLPAGSKWPQFWSACNTQLKAQG